MTCDVMLVTMSSSRQESTLEGIHSCFH